MCVLHGPAPAAFGDLMNRLGYDRYVAQGGDAGAGVIGALSRLHFPAMEVPELFAEDVRTWLRTFR
jgi:hypothetical protein